MATKTPVTLDGWYENTDGSYTYYYWVSGRLLEGSTFASLQEVAAYRQRCEAAEDERDRELDVSGA